MSIKNRSCGILLHITSLPSNYGVGTLGKAAYDFLDWMHKANLKIWQVLPLVPTGYGDSPYQSVSSSAYNYYLIDLDILREKKLLKLSEYKDVLFSYDKKHVDYELLFKNKIFVLKIAFKRFNKNDSNFKEFCKKQNVIDFALFMTIKEIHNYEAFDKWDSKYYNYSKALEREVIKNYNDEYLFWAWTQFEFLEEWNKLHNYAKGLGINIMGDMPLYVSYDSVEVWKYSELFILNPDKTRKLVAGCPPDAFSDDGQLWGNPVYNYDYMKKDNYKWWTKRINDAFTLYDILRIDHFRGFDRFYAIDANATTAKEGKWLMGPQSELFKGKSKLNIIAEDLGIIDDGVRKLLSDTKYPGMKVLEFAFDGNPYNDHLPSNFGKNVVVYTGTHDNMPFRQYLETLDDDSKERLIASLKNECTKLNIKMNKKSNEAICNYVVELAFASIATLAIIPMQDFLAEGIGTRMNFPSTVSKENWSYRVSKASLSDKLASRIKELAIKYKR